MEYKEILNKVKPEIDKTITWLGLEMAKIRTGRATPALIEDVVVDLFGQKMPLKQLGVISCPEPKQIVVQPWDKSYIAPIEKALSQSNLGAGPVVDQDKIRINLPPLTEEFRGSLMRLLSEKQEEARKTIRRWREEAWGQIQQAERDGEIREDDKFRAKDELQKLVDEYGKKIDELGERKKREISQ